MSDDHARRTVASFNFIDPDADDELWVGVTTIKRGWVGLAISLRHDGDFQVFFGPDEVVQLIEALQRARGLLGEAAPQS